MKFSVSPEKTQTSRQHTQHTHTPYTHPHHPHAHILTQSCAHTFAHPQNHTHVTYALFILTRTPSTQSPCLSWPMVCLDLTPTPASRLLAQLPGFWSCCGRGKCESGGGEAAELFSELLSHPDKPVQWYKDPFLSITNQSSNLPALWPPS